MKHAAYTKKYKQEKRAIIIALLEFFHDPTDTGQLKKIADALATEPFASLIELDVKNLVLSLYWSVLLDMGGEGPNSGYVTSKDGLAYLEILKASQAS